MAMVVDFVVGKAFEALYAGVEELIRRNLIFKSLFKDIKSSLDSLKPLIEEMEQYNQQLDLPKKELEAFEGLMKNGVELVVKCLEISRWNAFKKFKYANRLSEWDASLERQLKILNVQGIRDGKKTAVSVGNIEVSSGNIEVSVGHIEEELKEIKKLRATQNQSTETNKAWCAVPELPKLVVGLDVPLKELKMKLLEDDKVPMLVLTAPGGCGKTTLATMFCKDQQVKEKFGDNIFFVTVSQKGNLELIVKQLYKHKGSEVPTFQNEVHVAQWLHTFFKKEAQDPLLLVLDDVWSGSESILENFQFEMTNYKILVTSRSEFPRFGSSYHLQLLDDDNAMKLFHDSASLGDKISHMFEELSRKIVKHCNGFPLAITVVGRSLCKQPIVIWRNRVAEWSKGSSILDSETKLLLCLKSSLDALDKEMTMVKECFLDLGSFPEDNQIRVATLIDMWAELYDLDEDTLCFANVYELNNRSLATLVDDRRLKIEGEEDYEGYSVKQHDLLRELAIYHAKLDPVEHRKRVNIDICRNNLPKWWREQKYQPIKARLLSISTDEEFSMEWPDMQLPEAEVLVLNFMTKYYALPGFIEKMDKLKVLVVNSEDDAELSNFELLGLLPNLKRITLQTILIHSIIKNPIQLKSLRKISLYGCDIGQALNNEGFVKMSDAFPNVEEMNINLCNNSGKWLAEICDLVHLKKLGITNCQEVCALPEGIGNLVNLEVLRLRDCIDLLKLPGSITNLKKLNFLDLFACMDIEELPENMGEMNSLRKLDMRQCYDMKKLPESVLNLDQLEEVICDDTTQHLWEPFLPTLKNIRLLYAPVVTFEEESSKEENSEEESSEEESSEEENSEGESSKEENSEEESSEEI